MFSHYFLYFLLKKQIAERMLFYLNIYVQLGLGLFSVYLFNIQHLDFNNFTITECLVRGETVNDER